MENGTWPTMVKTASKTQASAVSQGSLLAWTVTASIYNGFVMATRTVPTTQTSWRECVVRRDAKSDWYWEFDISSSSTINGDYVVLPAKPSILARRWTSPVTTAAACHLA